MVKFKIGDKVKIVRVNLPKYFNTYKHFAQFIGKTYKILRDFGDDWYALPIPDTLGNEPTAWRVPELQKVKSFNF